jgi:hypothetical protein
VGHVLGKAAFDFSHDFDISLHNAYQADGRHELADRVPQRCGVGTRDAHRWQVYTRRVYTAEFLNKNG